MKLITFKSYDGAWSYYFSLGYVTDSAKAGRSIMKKDDKSVVIAFGDGWAVGGSARVVDKYLAAANSAE